MLYTEEAARAALHSESGKQTLTLTADDRLTPAAREWLSTNHVEIVHHTQQTGQTYTTPFGGVFTEKPEELTHLTGNLLVTKGHPRIALRGCIDALEAELLLATKQAQSAQIKQALAETLAFVRGLIRCDVLQEPVKDVPLCGMDAAALRERSHHPEKYYGQPHFIPSADDSLTLLRLNRLRTQVRQTELAAYRAYRNEDGTVSRPDFLRALNRLSSLLWILVIRCKAEGLE